MNSANRDRGVEIYSRWAAVWSGELPIGEVMAARFRLRYAQVGAESFNEITDVPTFADQIAAFRSARPGIVYTPEGSPVVDMDSSSNGLVAQPYLATIPAREESVARRISGTDILRCEAGEIVEVWSVSAGGKTYYPEPE